MRLSVTPMVREEIIAKLLSEYREELNQLSDVELLGHVQMCKTAAKLDEDEWRSLLGR